MGAGAVRDRRRLVGVEAAAGCAQADQVTLAGDHMFLLDGGLEIPGGAAVGTPGLRCQRLVAQPSPVGVADGAHAPGDRVSKDSSSALDVLPTAGATAVLGPPTEPTRARRVGLRGFLFFFDTGAPPIQNSQTMSTLGPNADIADRSVPGDNHLAAVPAAADRVVSCQPSWSIRAAACGAGMCTASWSLLEADQAGCRRAASTQVSTVVALSASPTRYTTRARQPSACRRHSITRPGHRSSAAGSLTQQCRRSGRPTGEERSGSSPVRARTPTVALRSASVSPRRLLIPPAATPPACHSLEHLFESMLARPVHPRPEPDRWQAIRAAPLATARMAPLLRQPST